jgi:hypothetical protein
VRRKTRKKDMKLRFSKDEAIRLFDDLFEFHGKHVILEPVFRDYFRVFKHLNDEEIDELLMEGRYEYKIIDIGVEMHKDKAVLAIWRPGDLGEMPLEEQDKIMEKLGRRRKGIFTVDS